MVILKEFTGRHYWSVHLGPHFFFFLTEQLVAKSSLHNEDQLQAGGKEALQAIKYMQEENDFH